MNGYEIQTKLSKMDNQTLLQKYELMNENYKANIDINLEVYFKLIDEITNRNMELGDD